MEMDKTDKANKMKKVRNWHLRGWKDEDFSFIEDVDEKEIKSILDFDQLGDENQ